MRYVSNSSRQNIQGERAQTWARRAISTLAATALAASLVPVAALAQDGNGVTAPAQTDGVYRIATADELVWFAQAVNDGSERAGHAQLVDDIDLGGATWTPIGSSSSTPFEGSFDGQGHIVSGIAFDMSAVTSYAGLFGFAAEESSIVNTSVTGTVSASAASAGRGIGGIVGHTAGMVIGCSSSVNMGTYQSSAHSSANHAAIRANREPMPPIFSM